MLIFADPHAGNRRMFSTVTEEGLNSRFVDVLKILKDIANYAKKTKQRNIICLGDVFESPGEGIAKDVLIYTHNAFKRLADSAEQLIILSGNHDLHRGRSVLSVFDDIPNVTVISEPKWLVIEGYDCAFLPYDRERNLGRSRIDLEKIGKVASKLKDPLLFGHFEVKGISHGRPGHETVTRRGATLNEIPFAPFKEIFLGHIHKPVDSGNIHIVGSILQNMRSEANDQKRLLTFVDGKLKEIKLGGPKFHRIEVREGNFDEFEKARGKMPDDFFDVILKDSITNYTLPSDFRIRIIRDYDVVRDERMDIKRADSQRDLLINYLEGLEISEKAKELALRIFDGSS